MDPRSVMRTNTNLRWRRVMVVYEGEGEAGPNAHESRQALRRSRGRWVWGHSLLGRPSINSL